MDTYCIRPDYCARAEPAYYVDEPAQRGRLVWQPDVYALADACARRLGASTVIDVGCGGAEKLIAMDAPTRFVGLDFGANLELCRRRHPQHLWVGYDADREETLPLPRELVHDAVVICADVIEHVIRPERLLRSLRRAQLEGAALIFLSTPDRERVRGREHLGPPDHPYHVREWTCQELAELLVREGFSTGAIGWTRQHHLTTARTTSLAVVARDERTLERVGVARCELAFRSLPLHGLRDHDPTRLLARLTLPLRLSANRLYDRAARAVEVRTRRQV